MRDGERLKLGEDDALDVADCEDVGEYEREPDALLLGVEEGLCVCEAVNADDDVVVRVTVPLCEAIWLGVRVLPMLTICVDVSVDDGVDDQVPERVIDAGCVWLEVAACEGVPVAVPLAEPVREHVGV